jgi:ferrous iron transport protein B
LWFLLNFPSTPVPTSVKKKGKQAVASFKIEKSYAAKAGKIIEPVIAPLGFDWRVGIGLVASLAAREVIVATMSQTYAIKSKGDSTKALSKALPALLKPPGATRHTRTQSLAVALSLLMFFVFALQCVSTLAVMHRETGSWKWPAISFASLLGLAYVSSFVTYRLTLWLGGA